MPPLLVRAPAGAYQGAPRRQLRFPVPRLRLPLQPARGLPARLRPCGGERFGKGGDEIAGPQDGPIQEKVPAACRNCNNTRLFRAGFAQGRQRWECAECHHNFMMGVKQARYPDWKRLQVLGLRAAGLSYDAIAREEKIHPSTVIRWVRDAKRQEAGLGQAGSTPAPSLLPLLRPRDPILPAVGVPPPVPPAVSISPVEFATGILGVNLWEKQVEVLEALASGRRVAVKAGNGLGKGFCAGVSVLWFLYSRDPAVVLTTAPTFRQVRHVLWRQVRSLYFRSRTPLRGHVLGTRWELAEDRYAMGLSAETADQFQGFHSPNMLVVVDEAAGVSDAIFEGIESVMTSSETSQLLLLGNPTTTSGAFRRAFHEERQLYECITISALESPNVTAGRIVVPGLTTAAWVKERREVWGNDNPMFCARVLGEFPVQDDNTLLPLTLIETATQLWSGDIRSEPVGTDAPVVIAVDPARFGSDHSVILRRRGNRVEDIQSFNGLDTMQLAKRVESAILLHHPQQVVVDEIGVGAGVLDRLRELGYPVHGVNVAKPAQRDGLFANLRAEGYWRLREMLEARQLALPPDQRLTGELAALKYEFRKGDNKLVLESKDSMKNRGLPSPDRADALMMAFLEPAPKPTLWT